MTIGNIFQPIFNDPFIRWFYFSFSQKGASLIQSLLLALAAIICTSHSDNQ